MARHAQIAALMLAVHLCQAAAGQCYLDALVGSASSTADEQGVSVGLDGSLAVLGAHLDDPLGEDSGSAYVFRESLGAWVEEARLTPSDGAAHDRFGESVDVSNDTIVVGAARHADDRGAAYVFRFDGAEWSQEAKLSPAAAEPDDFIALAVAIDGNVIVLGAVGDDDGCGGAPASSAGAAYIFRYDGARWVEEAKLLDPDCEAGAQFGRSVAVSGDVVVVGAARDAGPSQPFESGSASFFRYSGGAWIFEQKVWASDAEQGEWFGWACAVDGNSAVITARRDDDTGAESGSGYVYQYLPTIHQWYFEQKLVSDDAGAFAQMGYSASIDGAFVVLGAVGSGVGTPGAGAAIPFLRRAPGVWAQLDPLVTDPAATGDRLGASVDVHEGRVIAGAPAHDYRRIDDGAAFLFSVSPSCDCRVDMTGDGLLDLFDFLEFLKAFNRGDPIADFTGDGILDIFDFLEFQSEFAIGCS
ncbi:MAG: GC-type dockerin domain-anchored protein [Phycisphaerales bacterium JB039]